MAWYSNGPLTRLAAITSSALDDVTRVRRAWHWDTPRPRTWPEQGAVVPPPPSDLGWRELQAALDSGQKEAAERLANRLLRTPGKAANRWLRSQLHLSLAEVLKRDGMWWEALRVVELIEDERTLAHAVTDVVEAHVVWAEMILHGVRHMQRSGPYRDSEIAGPPDEDAYPCSEERSKELDRIQRLLQETISEERRKSLGIY